MTRAQEKRQLKLDLYKCLLNNDHRTKSEWTLLHHLAIDAEVIACLEKENKVKKQ